VAGFLCVEVRKDLTDARGRGLLTPMKPYSLHKTTTLGRYEVRLRERGHRGHHLGYVSVGIDGGWTATNLVPRFTSRNEAAQALLDATTEGSK
jgi:hypothetical protein